MSTKPRSRSKLALIAFAAVLAVALLFLRARRPAPTSSAPVAAHATIAAPPPPPKFAPEPATPAASDAPIVDEVSVEKQEVCEGEENLVTIKAHTNNGTDADLHYFVFGAQPGNPIPVRAWLDGDGQAHLPAVRVFGRGNATTEVAMPPFTVKKCPPRAALALDVALLANTNAEYDLFAKVVEPAELPQADRFKPVRFTFDFGDGETVVSGTPTVQHSYEDRPQETRFAHVLAAVEAEDGHGRKLIARRAIQLVNSAYESLHDRRTIQLFTTYTPRYPEARPDGSVSRRIRIWHRHPTPVPMTRIWLRRLTKGQAVEETTQLSPESVLGASTIPPGRGLEFSVTMTPDDPALALTYAIEGKTADGLGVAGGFSVMRPTALPTRESSVPVTDAKLEARIRRAQELLGRRYVTAEEMFRLERQGAFRDVVAENTAPTPRPEPKRERTR